MLWAKTIYNELRGNHYAVWKDNEYDKFKEEQDDISGIKAGAKWPESIAKAILGSDVFVALISDSYLVSTWCTNELLFALNKPNILKLIVLQHQDISLPDGIDLGSIQIQKLFYNETQFWNKLFIAIGANYKGKVENELVTQINNHLEKHWEEYQNNRFFL